jgi:cytochrome c-type biogenesis protein CcmE
MHPKRKKRLIGIAVILIGVGSAAAVATWSLRQNINAFHTPGDAEIAMIPAGRTFRIGGLVEPGSVERASDGLTVKFRVTDGDGVMQIAFDGILPDLFREGQGIIARGALDDQQVFQASEVLAKHDENYMPPEVAEALAEKGHPLPAEPEALNER